MEEDRGDQKPLELAIKRIVSAKLLVKPRDNNGGSLLRLFLASSVSGAIHYGWGMQISILTPYAQVYFLSFLLGAFMIFADPFIIFTMHGMQLLGVPHMFASLICSSGPLAGVLVSLFQCYCFIYFFVQKTFCLKHNDTRTCIFCMRIEIVACDHGKYYL
jgi:hypothetical protein